jgi:hypothetical protein
MLPFSYFVSLDLFGTFMMSVTTVLLEILNLPRYDRCCTVCRDRRLVPLGRVELEPPVPDSYEFIMRHSNVRVDLSANSRP